MKHVGEIDPSTTQGGFHLFKNLRVQVASASSQFKVDQKKREPVGPVVVGKPKVPLLQFFFLVGMSAIFEEIQSKIEEILGAEGGPKSEEICAEGARN